MNLGLFFLTEEEKEITIKKIFEEMKGEDLYPYEVIRSEFKENNEEYFRAMAVYHNII